MAVAEVYAVCDHMRERMDLGSVFRPGPREAALRRVFVHWAWGGRWANVRIRVVNASDRVARSYADVTSDAVAHYVDKNRQDKEAAQLVKKIVSDADAIDVEFEEVDD